MCTGRSCMAMHLHLRAIIVSIPTSCTVHDDTSKLPRGLKLNLKGMEYPPLVVLALWREPHAPRSVPQRLEPSSSPPCRCDPGCCSGSQSRETCCPRPSASLPESWQSPLTPLHLRQSDVSAEGPGSSVHLHLPGRGKHYRGSFCRL